MMDLKKIHFREDRYSKLKPIPWCIPVPTSLVHASLESRDSQVMQTLGSRKSIKIL